MKKIMLSALCLTLLVSATFFASGCKKKHTHSFTEQTVKDEYLSTAADCTNKAKYYYSCSCGEKGSATFEYGEALNHSFTNYVSDNNATCTEDGTKTAKCDRCDETNTVTDVNSKLPHTFDRQVVDDEYFCSSATYEQRAKYYYSCKCGEKGTETFDYGEVNQIEVKVYVDGVYSSSIYTDGTKGYFITAPEKPEDISINPNSEKYFDGWYVDSVLQTPLTENYKFTADGGKIYGRTVTVYTSSFQYRVDTGKAYITGFSGDGVTETTLVILAYLNGFPVEGIDENAFKDRTMLRSIIMCNGIKIIGANAFNGCNSVSEIKLPESLISIGNYAFGHCRSLASITIGNSVTNIGDSAFWGCSELTSIIIPDSVTSIGDSAFWYCSGLSNIEVDIGNTKYYSESNCIIEKETNVIVVGCKNSVIPAGVTSIGDSAFGDCFGLTRISIPDSVTSIGDFAFWYCSGLKDVIIGNKVKTICDAAFKNCSNLKTVLYKGTVEQWDNISIGYYDGNLTNADRYYYSENEPALNSDGTTYDGNYWHYADDGVTPVIWKKEK